MRNFKGNSIINYTGKRYGSYGKFFTVTIEKNKKLQESEPFVQVQDFPKRITLTMFKFFLENEAKEWIDTFGEDIIKKNLKLISPRSFLTTNFYEDKTYGGLARTLHYAHAWLYGDYSAYPCCEYKGEWKREYQGYGYKYIHLSPYRTWEKSFVEACLKDKYPYLKEFKFDAYGLSTSCTKELYIHCMEKDESSGENKYGTPLYVPIEALEKKDFYYVIKRMTDYFTWYYGSKDRKIFRDKALASLESTEANRLKEYLKTYR